jgi:hypothetical protein
MSRGAGLVPAPYEPPMTQALRHLTRIWLASLAAAACLVLPATASAHTLTAAKAKSVAAAQAQKIKRDTEAKSSTVTSCSRKTQHKFLCKVKSRYSSGLSTCVTDLTIYYATHASTRPKVAIGRSSCS